MLNVIIERKIMIAYDENISHPPPQKKKGGSEKTRVGVCTIRKGAP